MGPSTTRARWKTNRAFSPADRWCPAAKIAVQPTERAAELAEHINEIEARIRAALPIARAIYIEPDIYRPQAEATSATEAGTQPASA